MNQAKDKSQEKQKNNQQNRASLQRGWVNVQPRMEHGYYHDQQTQGEEPQRQHRKRHATRRRSWVPWPQL